MFAKIASTVALVAGILAAQVVAFDSSCNNNLVLYWGTNSYYNTHGGTPQDGQLTLQQYCASGSVDVVVMSFLDLVNVGGNPTLDIGWECDANNATNLFPNTNLIHCPQVASDIKYCQSQGVIVLLSIGGGAGNVALTGQANGETFADTLWNMFGGGSSSIRPFDDAILDGFDLDIEGGDDSGYVYTFNKLHNYFNSDTSKKYYLSGAPQCVYPGGGYMTSSLAGAWFDLVWPQFYNNYCSLTTPSSYNFADWDNWAKTQSINKNVKIYIGAPASTSAGGGYVDQGTLDNYISQAVNNFSTFGGVMFWDASQAWHNTVGSTNYGIATKNYLNSVGSCNKKPSTTSSISSTTTIMNSSTISTSTPVSTSKTTVTTTVTTTTSKTTTTSSTKTTTTSSTKTTSQTSSSTPTTCSSSNNGAYMCTASGSSPAYSECVNGNWTSFTCASGTVCIQSGSSIYCGFAS